MKRFVQCSLLALGMLGFLNYAEYREVNRRLDSIEYKVESVSEEPEDTVNIEMYPHTRVEEFLIDTDEQIQEEIRLGEMEMLAQLIHAEAGTEDLEGKRLVADVVLNRVEAGFADGTLEGVIFQKINDTAMFTTVYNGMFDEAGYHMLESDYLAAQIEYEAEHRLDDKILYFRTGHYHTYGTPAYRHGGHYFSYE